MRTSIRFPLLRPYKRHHKAHIQPKLVIGKLHDRHDYIVSDVTLILVVVPVKFWCFQFSSPQ